MSTSRLTTTSYVVLGMLAMRGPSTSYQLKRAVGRSVGYFWPFPHAQLYSEPKRLVQFGLLDVLTEDEGRRRQTFSVTGAGVTALTQWLAEPSEEPLQVRDVGELKLFFAELTEPANILSLAARQVAQHEERIAVYEEMQARFGGRGELAHRMVPLRLGLAMEYAALQFWQDLQKERS
jgi:PadR family transcriptional regulator AphA